MKIERLIKDFQGDIASKKIIQDWQESFIKRQFVEKRFNKFTGYLFILGDLHIPYTNWDLVFKEVIPDIIETKKKNKVLVVLPGDTLNCDLFSDFPKMENTFLPTEEVKIAKNFTGLLKRAGCQTIMILSNHETRLIKFIKNTINGWMEQKELIHFLKTWDELFGNNVSVIENWFCEIADTVITHGKPASNVKGRTVHWALQYFENFKKWILPNEFNVVIQAHNHQQGIVVHQGKIGIEVGTLSKPITYQFNDKGYQYGKWGDWCRGYCKIHLVNGKTDKKGIQLTNLD